MNTLYISDFVYPSDYCCHT